MIFDGGQLGNHNHIEAKRDTAVLYKPLDIFSVNEVNVSRPYEGSFAFGLCTNSHGADEVLKVILLICFSSPSIPCHTQRCNNQSPMNLKVVKQKVGVRI